MLEQSAVTSVFKALTDKASGSFASQAISSLFTQDLAAGEHRLTAYEWNHKVEDGFGRTVNIFVSADTGLEYKIPINFRSTEVDFSQKLVFYAGGKPYIEYSSPSFYAKLTVSVYPLYVELLKN